MRFRIPDEAATGAVQFISASNSILYATPEPLVIHNPVVDFYPGQAPPVCADEDVPLVGFPEGGTFSSPVPTTILVITGTLPVSYRFDGRGAGWGPNHQDFIDVPVSYIYKAQYSTGDRCFTPDTVTKVINVRDNRLLEIVYEPKITVPGSANPPVPLGVDRAPIRSSIHNLLVSSFNLW